MKNGVWGTVRRFRRERIKQIVPQARLFFYLRQKVCNMIVERTNKEVIIRLPATVDTEDLQDFLNYARYKELTTGIHVEQKLVDTLASELNKKWWGKNKNKFVK